MGGNTEEKSTCLISHTIHSLSVWSIFMSGGESDQMVRL